jgi:hypothetical protein
VGGIVYARGFDHHQLVEWADLEDVLSDVYTEMYGVLCWRELAQVPKARADAHGRDSYYRSHLEKKPVPDSLLVAQRFLAQEITGVT